MEATDSGVDVEAMDEANAAALKEIKPDDAGTPTVFDATANEVVDISDPDWLDQLVESRLGGCARALLAVLTATLVALVGCSRTVAGTARPDPRNPAGADRRRLRHRRRLPDAPVRSRSSPSRSASTARICRRISVTTSPATSISASSTVTYRPMTFLDDTHRRVFRPGQQCAVPGAPSPLTYGDGRFRLRPRAMGDQHPGGRTHRRGIADVATTGRLSRRLPSSASRVARPRWTSPRCATTNFGYLFEVDPIRCRNSNGLRSRRTRRNSTSTTTTGWPS